MSNEEFGGRSICLIIGCLFLGIAFGPAAGIGIFFVVVGAMPA